MAFLAVTVCTLLGTGTVLTGLGLGVVGGSERSHIGDRGLGGVGAAPLSSCLACSAAGTAREPSSKAVDGPPSGPAGGQVLTTASPTGASGAAHSVPTALPSEVAIPSPAAARTEPVPTTTLPATEAPPGAGRGSQATSDSNVVNLAPVATVGSSPSGVTVGLVGTAAQPVAQLTLGCGTPSTAGIGVALGGTASCPDAASPSSPSGSSGSATAPSGPAAPGGLLAVTAGSSGGLEVQVLPNSNGSLLGLTVCTSTLGLVLTVLDMKPACDPASTGGGN